jgi:hypothetical protein
LGIFFKFLNGALGLRMVTRPGRKLSIAHGPEFAAQYLLADADAIFLENPLREIDKSPAHHAMDRRNRTRLDQRRQRPLLLVFELRDLARSFSVYQTLEPSIVEPQDPIPNSLKADTADPRRFAARAAVINLRKREQTAGDASFFLGLRQHAKPRSIEIFA